MTVATGVQVLIDSGEDDNFIDCSFVKTNMPTCRLLTPKEVQAVDGKLLEVLAYKTEPLKLMLSSNHHDFLELFVISSPMNFVILGIPCLKLHN